MRFPIRVALIVILASSSVAKPSSTDLRYSLSLLPVPKGCASTVFWGHGFSDKGTAIGNLSCGDGFEYRAVVWAGESAVELLSLGGPNSYPLGISRNGETIVGMADTPQTQPDGSYLTRPVKWRDAVPSELPILGELFGAATDINARGVVVGICQSGAVDSRVGRQPFRACLWKEDTLADLGDLGGPEAQAFDVSDRGWVVGWSNTAEPIPAGNGFAYRAFLHDGTRIRSLGTLGGTTSEAWGVNERGEVVGYSATDILGPRGRPEQHAFRWYDGVLEDLGTLGGGVSEARGINDFGDIVGGSLMVDDRGRRRNVAALWKDGTISNLNELVDDLQGWTLTRATAIDNVGRILVQAQRGIEERVAILVPQGAPVQPKDASSSSRNRGLDLAR